MQYLEEFLDAPDGHEIPVRLWRPKTVDNILVIAHGMAEYCERYAPLADWLTESNIAVVALNHRGHGMDCPESSLGYFADSRGWQKVLDDLDQTIQFARKELPRVPMTLMGHSMGSFIAQSFIQQHPSKVDRLILMSTNTVDRVPRSIDYGILKTLKFFKGANKPSELIESLSFKKFNKYFAPNRTENDWLSRDNEHVDAYVADPYCGFACSVGLWCDLLKAMLELDIPSWPNDLPIHLLSGTADAVGDMGKGVTKLSQSIKNAGKTLSSFKLYDGARHELVNETNAEEVWGDVRTIVQGGALS